MYFVIHSIRGRLPYEMKNFQILVIIVLVFSCTKKKTDSENHLAEIERDIVVTEFQAFIDSADVTGSILLYDLYNDTYYSNDFNWTRKGHLPASTFKIPNSMIALETGVVENDSTLFEWKGD